MAGLAAPLRPVPLDERIAKHPNAEPIDAPAVPADMIGDLIPSWVIVCPSVPPEAEQDVRLIVGGFDTAIQGVMAAREAAREAVQESATMSVSAMLTGAADRVVAAVVAALEAEERVRIQIAAFIPIAKQAAREAHAAAMPGEAAAREAIAAKLAKLGYHHDTGNAQKPGYFAYFPTAINVHPTVVAAKDRIAVAKALRDSIERDAQANADALAAVRRSLIAARQRAMTF